MCVCGKCVVLISQALHMNVQREKEADIWASPALPKLSAQLG